VSLRYTTEELIEEVRNRAVIPDTESQGWTDDDILLYLNGEMMMELIPQVAKLHEEFMIVTELITLTPTSDIENTHIEIPDRASGNSLRDIILVKGGDRIQIPRINREDLPSFQINRGEGTDIRGYFIENSRIRIFPGAEANNQLEVSYRFRPSQLVKAASYRTATSVNLTLKEVTLSGAAPPPFSVGDKVDIHGPNSGAEIRVWDNEITAIVGTTLTLTDPIDGTDSREGRQIVKVGDFTAPREQCAIPMLPRELHAILAQAAVCRVTEGIDDGEKLQMHTRQLNRQLQLMEFSIAKRVEGRPRKVVNRLSPLWRQGNIQRRSI
jgi:hypothetical protein